MAKRICGEPDCDKPAVAQRRCTRHYQRDRKSGVIGLVAKRSLVTCQGIGCEKPRKPGASLCSMHSARLSRTGSLDLLPRTKPHPISTSGYRVVAKEYEHRRVLRAVIGDEPHPCHWCNRMLTWGVDLHVDHLDHDKLNNDPHNLVPSCQPCNNRRTRHWAHGMTHCRRGHEFDAQNTGRNALGHRFCKTCQRLASRRYDAKKRREAAATKGRKTA